MARVMRLFPHRTFIIESPLGFAEVEARLRAGVEPVRWYRSSRDHAPFEGSVDGSRFDVRRVIHYRNSFLPRVTGTIEQVDGGTRLAGTMQLHPAVMAFVSVWFGLVTLMSLVVAANVFADGGLEPIGVIPVLMFVFGVALVLGGFVTEARRALRELARLVNASRSELG